MANILLLCEYPTLCGGERSMLSTFNGVQAAGFRLTVAAPPHGPLANALAEAGVEHVAFSTSGRGGERQSPASLRCDLDYLLHRLRPELLHANSLAMSRLAGPVAADAGVPSVGHLRDIVRLSRQAIDDLNQHRRLLAVSEAVRRYHVLAGLDPGKTCVAYNGVDLAAFQPRPPTGFIHHELQLPRQTRFVGVIGQICLRKGQDVLVEAATVLASRFPDIHYLLVGQRNSKKQESLKFETGLQVASREGPLAGRLHFLGERGDVAQLLGELTILAHPARQEPLGRVLLEAAAAGVPIVATDVGGTREIFPIGSGAARLVPQGNPAALAEAIVELLGDRERRCALGHAARTLAESAFGIDRAVRTLVAHYADLTSCGR